MTNKDYKLLLMVCQYALRKGFDLNETQVTDIDNVMRKLYNKVNIGGKIDALVRNKKMGKTTRV
jgi:hypothetical protein